MTIFITMFGKKNVGILLLVFFSISMASANPFQGSPKRSLIGVSWFLNDYSLHYERLIPYRDKGFWSLEFSTALVSIERELVAPNQSRLATNFFRTQSVVVKRYVPKLSRNGFNGLYWGMASFLFITKDIDLVVPLNHKYQIRSGPVVGFQLKIFKGFYWDAAYYQTVRFYFGHSPSIAVLPLVLGAVETKLSYRYNF